MTYYAWSNFPVERNEFGQPTKTIKAGEKISQSDLSVSDEEWEELVNIGAVREEEYPDVGPSESPAEWAAANPEEAGTETEGEAAQKRAQQPAQSAQPQQPTTQQAKP
jgi:hypothetical protein